ncbi:MAG: hypothetical protein ACJAXJ_001538 [Colwellia sp.]|jgi:hypothetical protein
MYFNNFKYLFSLLLGAIVLRRAVMATVNKRKARKTTSENKAATFAKAVNKVSKPLKVK